MHKTQEVQIQHTSKPNDINDNTRATQQQHKHVLNTIYKHNHKHNTHATLNNNKSTTIQAQKHNNTDTH